MCFSYSVSIGCVCVVGALHATNTQSTGEHQEMKQTSVFVYNFFFRVFIFQAQLYLHDLGNLLCLVPPEKFIGLFDLVFELVIRCLDDGQYQVCEFQLRDNLIERQRKFTFLFIKKKFIGCRTSNSIVAA